MTSKPQVECFGRESVCERLIRAEREDGAAFLFGGPLAGKRTVLWRVHEMLVANIVRKASPCTPVVPVFAELRQLGADFTPLAFYQLLAQKALDAVAGCLVISASPPRAASSIDGYEGFLRFLGDLQECCRDYQPKLYFLLNDCKRITCFPRGFQDNLVHLLWGRHGISGRVSIAFSGGQELHSFFLDPTTALRMRSVEVILENLGLPALVEMASAIGIKGQHNLADQVLEITGGHAGISWLLLKRLGITSVDIHGLAEGVIAEFCSDKQHVMRRWHDSLSTEAKSVAIVLAAGAPVSRSSAANALRAANFDPALNIRAFNELTFTGMAVREGTNIRKAGRIFWDFFRTAENAAPTGTSRPILSGSRFIFKRIDRSWWFRFDGEDYGNAHKQLDGFRYIAFLLRRKTDPTHCVKLKLECKQPPEETARHQLEQFLNDVERGYGPKQKYATKQTNENWKTAIEQVDELIAEAKEAGDNEKAERLEDQKERLEKERSKQVGLGGRLRPETTAEALEDKTRKAVGKAMKEAIAYLRKNCRRLGEHLDHGTQGIECYSNWPSYRGPHQWDTEEVATRKVAKR
jgi:hypothetical protein